MMTNKKTGIRAQSAMEYLMTYGWAILIIAIVLGALFSLGVFSTSAFVSTSCIPASGYYCSVQYLHLGTFNVIVGQSTGTTWSSANIFFVTGGGVPTTSTSFNTLSQTACVYFGGTGNAISSGQQITISLTQPVIISAGTPSCGTTYSSTIGTSYSGTMWAQYTTSSVSGFQYAQIATATLKAT